MNEKTPTEIFAGILEQARAGALPFEAMVSLLETSIEGENYPVAEVLYRTWRENVNSQLRFPKLVHERAKRCWLKLQQRCPDIARLPDAVDYLIFAVDGREIHYRDITDSFFIEVVGRIHKHTITMLEGAEPPWALYKSIEYLVRNKIPGDLVECGVWNGGSVLLMALALQHFGDTSRRIYLYDTFAGMPKPDDVDRDWDGIPALPTWKAKHQPDSPSPNFGFGGTVEMVQEVVYGSGYPKEKFVFVKGLVEDTIPAIKPDAVALLRLDTDFYSSTYHELTYLYPDLVAGGVLIIDDYGYFQGARIATDQYIEENGLPIFLSRVNQGVRLAIKPG